MTNSARNIDDLIHGFTPPEQDKKEVEPKEVPEIPEDNEESYEEPDDRETESVHEETTQEDSGERDDQGSDNEDVDDYGNKIPKSKLYTEEEVNKIMRDRFSRGAFANNSPQQQAQLQEAAQGFEADPNSNETWETQLEGFIKETVNKIEREAKTKEWQQVENERQAEFESKFTSGMNKYKDFQAVTQKLPITDSMMMAIRDFKDPAGFIYAAAKMNADELRKIASMNDPYAQAAHIGRLEEKMRKAKNISKTAAPLQPTKGDTSSKERPKQSIDSKIIQHAKSKLRR